MFILIQLYSSEQTTKVKTKRVQQSDDYNSTISATVEEEATLDVAGVALLAVTAFSPDTVASGLVSGTAVCFIVHISIV